MDADNKIEELIDQHKMFAENLYALLNDEANLNDRYEKRDLGEGMTLVNYLISGWWKPRFIMNNDTKTAFEFMDKYERLLTVTEDDIKWRSVNRLEHNEAAHNLCGYYPTLIGQFKNGAAQVEWQLHPDGRYYEDDDGFGMTDDEEEVILGFIDKDGRVVSKFRNIGKWDWRLDWMRIKAERNARKGK
jgi:hypothetical protein